MLDQSFSVDNFRKIIDQENRKGTYLAQKYFPDIAALNVKIKELKVQLKTLSRKQTDPELFEKEKIYITTKLETLQQEKDEKYVQSLTKCKSEITKKNFKITLSESSGMQKPIYQMAEKIENVLALKQIQYNLRKVYKVKQSSRHTIINQLVTLLDDSFPKIVIRTDIKDFYESIDQELLLNKINNDSLLTHLSRKIITQILVEYKSLSGSIIGVPRGIGISPYLAELYMREIDESLNQMKDLIFYARYVDDIILIFTPPIDESSPSRITYITEVIEKHRLKINKEKTDEISINEENQSKIDFEYLGYRYRFSDKKLRITLSKKKRRKYAKRLLTAFKIYDKEYRNNEKKSRKILVKRIQFLMSITRLHNNKRNIITGLYATNRLINDVTDLDWLDRVFSKRTLLSKCPQKIKEKLLTKYSFKQGFEQRRFIRFKAIDLRKALKNWY